MTERLQVPTRAQWNNWKERDQVTVFFNKFLSVWIEAFLEKFVSGDLIEGKSNEEIVLENIRTQTKAAIFHSLLNLTYDEVCTMMEVNPIEEDDDD